MKEGRGGGGGELDSTPVLSFILGPEPLGEGGGDKRGMEMTQQQIA